MVASRPAGEPVAGSCAGAAAGCQGGHDRLGQDLDGLAGGLARHRRQDRGTGVDDELLGMLDEELLGAARRRAAGRARRRAARRRRAGGRRGRCRAGSAPQEPEHQPGSERDPSRLGPAIRDVPSDCAAWTPGCATFVSVGVRNAHRVWRNRADCPPRLSSRAATRRAGGARGGAPWPGWRAPRPRGWPATPAPPAPPPSSPPRIRRMRSSASGLTAAPRRQVRHSTPALGQVEGHQRLGRAAATRRRRARGAGPRRRAASRRTRARASGAGCGGERAQRADAASGTGAGSGSRSWRHLVDRLEQGHGPGEAVEVVAHRRGSGRSTRPG